MSDRSEKFKETFWRGSAELIRLVEKDPTVVALLREGHVLYGAYLVTDVPDGDNVGLRIICASNDSLKHIWDTHRSVCQSCGDRVEEMESSIPPEYAPVPIEN